MIRGYTVNLPSPGQCLSRHHHEEEERNGQAANNHVSRLKADEIFGTASNHPEDVSFPTFMIHET